MNNSVSGFRSYFPLILIGVISIFLLLEFYVFLNAFLGAVILYVLLRPLMERLVNKKNWKRSRAAILLMLATLLVVLLPILGFSYLLVARMSVMFNESSFFFQAINTLDQKFMSAFGIQLFSAENLKSLQEKGTQFITSFLSESLGMLADIAIMNFVLYYMLVNFGKVEQALNKYVPLSGNDLQLLGDELRAQTNSNAIGAPLLALIQGIVAWIGYLIFGIEGAFFWGIMTGFFSFVPFVGTALIWAPAAVYLLTFAELWKGIGLVLYGIVVIGTADNIFRFVFQKKFADVHPVITVFGVIIGLRFFGVPGIIFGPLLLSWFLILVKIYRKDFSVQTSKDIPEK